MRKPCGGETFDGFMGCDKLQRPEDKEKRSHLEKAGVLLLGSLYREKPELDSGKQGLR